MTFPIAPFGHNPMSGAPYIEMPNGHFYALTSWIVHPELGFLTVLKYGDPVLGTTLWNNVGEPFCTFEAIYPNGSTSDDRVLSKIIEARGGPVPFILEYMAHCSRVITADCGFAPQWLAQNSLTEFENAIKVWKLSKYTVNPALVIATPNIPIV